MALHSHGLQIYARISSFFPLKFYVFIVFLQSSSQTSTVWAGVEHIPCQAGIVLQQKKERGWRWVWGRGFSKAALQRNPGCLREERINPSAPILSLWTQAVPVPRAVLWVNTLMARGRWQKRDNEGSCASSWGFLKKQAQARPSPDSFESSFWQMPGLKSSLCVPKGWINRLLRHNYSPTVPKLVTNKAIVHFHLMQKREQKPSWLILVIHIIMHNYNLQLQKLLMQTAFFSASKPEHTMLCTQPCNIAACWGYFWFSASLI